MRELSTYEIEQTSGGIAPLVIAIVATDSFAIGFTAGVITGYATIKSLFK
jgi:lactobin A/cerein 7B family class IIb bacteriocin